ncbi:hypothetical protein [Pseudomonas sp. 22 E 5]|nr:hypothetical protein [Pseudomonas sp. 22 E 5]
MRGENAELSTHITEGLVFAGRLELANRCAWKVP